MRERIDETIQIPSLAEALVNTSDAVAKRITAEFDQRRKLVTDAQKRYEALISSYDATFVYRVGLILADPEVTLPALPQWDREVAG